MAESRFTPGRFAKDAQGKAAPVVCLAELVPLLASGLPAPELEARATVLQRLAADGAALFVVLDPRAWARPVEDGDIWRPAMCTGAASWREAHPHPASDDYGFVTSIHMGCMHGDEALMRGLPLHASDPTHAAWLKDDEWRALPPLPALQGRAGALTAFALCGADGAAQAAPEFTRMAMALAMTQADAERVFPELAPPASFWEDAPTAAPLQVAPADPAQRWQTPAQAPAVLHLVPAPAPVQKVQPLVQGTAHNAQPAGKADLKAQWQVLVDAYAEECKAGKRGAQTRVLSRWEKLLPGVPVPTHQSLSRTLARAKNACIKQSSTPANSAFAWTGTAGASVGTSRPRKGTTKRPSL